MGEGDVLDGGGDRGQSEEWLRAEACALSEVVSEVIHVFLITLPPFLACMHCTFDVFLMNFWCIMMYFFVLHGFILFS